MTHLDRSRSGLATVIRTTGIRIGLMATCCVAAAVGPSRAAEWSVAAGNALLLDTTTLGQTVSEMSGVAYLGPSPVAGWHRFLTVPDEGDKIVTLDVAFDLGGNLTAAVAVAALPLIVSRDYEGIAIVDDAIFLSDEDTPSVRQIDPATGTEVHNIGIPPLFTNQLRDNNGFESLAYDTVGARLWTANEEALLVDGPSATPSIGTTVRLLELNVAGSSPTAQRQFAYVVDPIHGPTGNGTRSGLSELVAMPDGTLLALERSLAQALPPFESRLYEISFSGATDVSMAPFDEGLAGATFTPVGKELLWSGQAGGGFGQNLEGLTVGPRLPGGDWILLGVVDDGDPLSSNTVAAFRATPTTPIGFAADTGDLDADAGINGADVLAWQRGFGLPGLAGIGDGNHDGTVTGADLALWSAQFGAPTGIAKTQAVPEPSAFVLLLLCTLIVLRAEHLPSRRPTRRRFFHARSLKHDST